ncbi:tRNA guanosine(34) transglycosylase Tgt [Patescibacteria group bacterium]|nr:tRNA guanosine(34) transglycosylase Tgt [Patescibacteria group bacterium]MBU1895663.1 tRNA guanosine(34) transglycosylase Tgt [Patescibacteria group bacterium]
MFKITHKSTDCQARAGIIHTDHGDIETPIFMPVGTQATVKSLDSNDLENLNAQIILANTYHLHLRPGEDLIAEQGGLHKFMNWNRPILTDSGGFQVFSLQHVNTSPQQQSEIRNQKSEINNEHSHLVKIDNDGVEFKSYIDGSTHRFTPESAIEIQHKLGADIIMAFDECTPDDKDEKYVREAMERTHSWAERCLKYHKSQKSKVKSQKLFGIIQGANYENLRKESAKFISSLDFDGIAIGGESVGFNMEATKQILDWVIPIIPENKPHYTMGVGHSPLDLFEIVERGVDMFDCVSPTRMARNGTLFVHPKISKKHRIDITKANFKNDPNPIDSECTCPVCLPDIAGRMETGKNYSRTYIHHLFKAQELLAYRLATIHNIHFFLDLMKQIRLSIAEDRFIEFKKKWFTT